MNADERGYFDALTERVLGAVFEVSNTLGAGFLEESLSAGAPFGASASRHSGWSEASFEVSYKGQLVGEYFADLLVEDVLVVELK